MANQLLYVARSAAATSSAKAATDMEREKRSIIVLGLSRNIELNKVIKAFEELAVTGGGLIQNFDYYDNDKLCITYLNKKGLQSIKDHHI